MGPNGDVGPVPAGVAGPLGEQRDADGILARALARNARQLHARGHVDTDGRDREQRLADVGGRQAAGERDRDLARDRRGERGVDPRARAARVGPAGRVEQDPLGAGVEEGPGAPDDVIGSIAGSDAQCLPCRTAEARRGPRQLVAVELDRVGVHGRQDAGKLGDGQVRGDDHDAG